MRKLDLVTSFIQTIIIGFVALYGIFDALIHLQTATKLDGLFIMVACFLFTESIKELVSKKKEADAPWKSQKKS